MTAATMEEIVHPDGRHELTPDADASLDGSPLHNQDLAPVPLPKRTWTTYNYLALWVGMSINIPSWALAAGLITLGMDWVQAIITIGLGNLIVLIPMLLISHAGTKYGIPYPVVSRGSFGVWGANLPALLRAGVACGWFGIQTWIGGLVTYAIGASFFTWILGEDNFWTTASEISISWIPGLTAVPYSWAVWLSFLIFWALNMFIVVRGMDTIKRFENWAAPFMVVVFLGLMTWMIIRAGGLGPVVEQAGTLGWGPDFWAVFPISLMGMIAFWSTLSLNMPDFTRFGRSQREQMVGQAAGLPTTMTLFPLIGVLTVSATVVVFGEAIWDPGTLVSQLDNAARRDPHRIHAAARHPVDQRGRQRGEPVLRLLQPLAEQDQLPHRRHHHGHRRHPDHAVVPDERAEHLHLHLARHLRRPDRRHRRRPDR